MSGPIPRLSAALADRYHIERELGQGGMATVYLAQDLKHDRKVAIKVLRPELAAVIGAERFLSEIKTTANLQHPHILPLHDSGAADSFLYYVMPFIEGESLRDRLSREKQLPVQDAIRIATEVAGALDYAHRHGVIHRDIKPENILLHDGRALVADFGIALAASKAGGTRMTETGMSLGTPHYMSPEQAMGEREITARSDVYALGAVTYEMLLGEPPFTGPTAQSIVARVMTEAPRPLSAQRHSIPEPVEAAVLTALEKLPADRFSSAAEFAAALAGQTVPRASVRSRRARVAPVRWAAAWLLAAAAFIAVGWLLRAVTGPSGPERRPVRRAVMPMSSEFDVRGSDVGISADGQTIIVNDNSRILVRRTSELEARLVPNSRGGLLPFLSRDGQRVGFAVGENLVVQGIDGSDPVTLASVAIRSATFLDRDRIIASDTSGLVMLNSRTGERAVLMANPPGFIFLQPHILPDGHHLLATLVGSDLNTGRAVLMDLREPRIDTLPVGPALAPQYSEGYLYFVRPTGTLFAIQCNPRDVTLTGSPHPVGESVVVARLGRAFYGVGNGLIVYGARPRGRIVAWEPGGRRTVLLAEPGNYHNPKVSPDGSRIVFDRDDGGPEGRDVWLLNLATLTVSRVTSVGDAHDAHWAPDGRHVTFLSFRTRGGPVVTVSAQGDSGQSLISIGAPVNPGAWYPDGSTYLANITQNPGNADVVAYASDGTRRATIIGTRYDEHSPAISPDAHWLAYTSRETGDNRVYVHDLVRGGGRFPISVGNGEEPVWGRDGKSLFYVEHEGEVSRLLAARLAGEPLQVLSRSVVIENLLYQPVGNHANWDVMPDGRMVFVEPMSGSQLILVFDWAPEAGQP